MKFSPESFQNKLVIQILIQISWRDTFPCASPPLPHVSDVNHSLQSPQCWYISGRRASLCSRHQHSQSEAISFTSQLNDLQQLCTMYTAIMVTVHNSTCTHPDRRRAACVCVCACALSWFFGVFFDYLNLPKDPWEDRLRPSPTLSHQQSPVVANVACRSS